MGEAHRHEFQGSLSALLLAIPAVVAAAAKVSVLPFQFSFLRLARVGPISIA